jgi:predicted CopG family antitoxin
MPRPEQIQFLIYPPSKQKLEEWRGDSRKFGTSLNNYIIEMIERGRRSDEGESRAQISRELSDLKEENRKLREEVKLKSLLLERQETELYKLRFQPFGNMEQTGARAMDAELVKLLKKGRKLTGHEILDELNVDPRDSEAVKLVKNQLEALQRYGLTKETQRGWQWL